MFRQKVSSSYTFLNFDAWCQTEFCQFDSCTPAGGQWETLSALSTPSLSTVRVLTWASSCRRYIWSTFCDRCVRRLPFAPPRTPTSYTRRTSPPEAPAVRQTVFFATKNSITFDLRTSKLGRIKMRIRVKRLKAVDCFYYEHQMAPYVQFNLAALTSLASQYLCG